MKTNDSLIHFKQISTFNDFISICKGLTKKDKGDLFEIFTYYLFKFLPQLNHNINHIWLYNDIPKSTLKKLNLPDKDKGIDLIIKRNNEYYAIQCKFRQKYSKVICWDELSTFFGLTFGIGNNIIGGYLVTNTFDMCEEVLSSTKIELIYGNYFEENLPSNFFENVCKDIEGTTLVPYTIKEPFDFQQKCINQVCNYLKENEKCNIVK